MSLALALLAICVSAERHVQRADYTALHPADNAALAAWSSLSRAASGGYEPSLPPESTGVALLLHFDAAGFPDSSLPVDGGRRPPTSAGGRLAPGAGPWGTGAAELGPGDAVVWAQGPLSRSAAARGAAVSAWALPRADGPGVVFSAGAGGALEGRVDRGAFTCSVALAGSPHARASARAEGVVQGSWNHVACTFDPVTLEVAAYVNGTAGGRARVNATAVRPLEFAGRQQVQPFAVGNTVIPAVRSSFVGLIDELVVYAKPLAAASVRALSRARFNAFASHVPFLEGLPMRLPSGGPVRSVLATWDPRAPEGSVSVQLSTDGGLTWCDAARGANATLGSSACRFPAAAVAYRVRWSAVAALRWAEFELSSERPQAAAYAPFAVGVNLEGVARGAASMPFVDSLAYACGVDGVARVDERGYPLAVDRRARVELCLPACAPGGRWAFIGDGEGHVEFAHDGGDANATAAVATTVETVALPAKRALLVGAASALGMALVNMSSANRFRRLHLYAPEVADRSALVAPGFLGALGSPSVVRFAEWGRVDNSNVAHWHHNARLDAFSQNREVTYAMALDNVSEGGPRGSRYLGEAFPWAAVATARPHGLVTGQRVRLASTTASVTVRTRDGGTQEAGLQGAEFVVEVAGPKVFHVSLEPVVARVPDADLNRKSEFSGAKGGVATLTVYPGVAVDYLLEVSHMSNSDPWLCVPHLATDDYVRQMARNLRDFWPATKKFIIEYSSNLWGANAQGDHAARMARANWMLDEEWVVKRSLQVFKIFVDEFSKGDSPERLVKVLSSSFADPSVSWRLLAAHARLSTAAVRADALAVAPFFGDSLAGALPRPLDPAQAAANATLLELLRDAAYDDVGAGVAAHGEAARAHGLRLFAYSGGQRLAPPAASADAVAFAREANRATLMGDLYEILFERWSALGGSLFVTSRLTGSYAAGVDEWGLVEQQGAASAKYEAVQRAAQRWRAQEVPANTTSPSSGMAPPGTSSGPEPPVAPSSARPDSGAASAASCGWAAVIVASSAALRIATARV
eukprot:m51a1_g4396 hypothetical protein (1037) ;mRNA; r:373658-377304